jgi:hypothetical protein
MLFKVLAVAGWSCCFIALFGSVTEQDNPLLLVGFVIGMTIAAIVVWMLSEGE